MYPIYLASSSPRRAELLTQLGVPFTRLKTDVMEQRHPQEGPQDYVVRLSQDKARAGVAVAVESMPVLGADTIVVLNNQVLEKPLSVTHAFQMLTQLSGKTHEVITAVTVATNSQSQTVWVKTAVEFCVLTPQQINHYIATQEPMDKAGAYGIQGLGGNFVRQIHGSYSAVVGLPLVETRELLADFSQYRER
ncbi:septum formation inhibitor Maf [Rosenbergiella australiborealis]|uniref:dTTP/UTP pyrophosphatase n=1 Tax=Rosenbergiella australiborealis TaxID=1544696 RepID=A0ABS5T300_9GAMM|nr:Maf family protein [Rosenbergiella australiborealis]MBT0725807.1 septum formation inhibitor Maf [Rosenbergiella australiborealis]